MKRTALLITSLAIAVLAAASLVMAQYTPSVPNLINFQGRLTDNTGNPVADGAHSVHFYIFPVRTGGISVWDELQNPTTTGGLFTTQLGLLNPLPQTLFQDYDSLFLEIVADAQTISPRALLSSTPSTRIAEGLEGKSPYNPGTAFIRTDPGGHQLSTYGADGLEQIRLWGPSWGEMVLWDSDVSNDLTSLLTSTDAYFGPTGKGGALYLGNDAGLYTIRLHGDAVGDGSVELPTDAIDADEMLNEPGMASTYKDVLPALTFVTTAYDTITITAPTAGFIAVMAYGYFYFNHTNGTEDVLRAYISDTPGGQDFDNFAITSYPAVAATGGNPFASFSITKTVAVGSGSHTYYLDADKFNGSGYLGRPRMTAMFFPTNYGTVVSTKPAISDAGGALRPSINADAAGSNVSSSVQVTTVADHQAQLEAERAKQIADLEARIKKLEGQMAGQLPGTAVEMPRKER